MTGSFDDPTRIRRITRKSAAALGKENVADRSKQRKHVVSQCQISREKTRSKSKRMYFSDDSSIYETTASQDERIAAELQKKRENEKARLDFIESERKEAFEEAFQEHTHEVFSLQGLSFLKFTHTKIKLCFEPRKVIRHVKKDLRFYCSLKYFQKYKFWSIRRDSFPVNYKSRIYNIFYKKVPDATIADAVISMYIKLKMWATEEEEFRIDKYKRYQNGEDVYLDSDDEEIFLSTEQRNELHRRRERILKRMVIPTDPKLLELPPESPVRERRRRIPRKATESKLRPESPVMKKKRRIRRKLIESM